MCNKVSFKCIKTNHNNSWVKNTYNYLLTTWSVTLLPALHEHQNHFIVFWTLSLLVLSVSSASPAGSGLLQPSGNQPRGLSEGDQVHRQRPRREALLQRDGRVGAEGHRGRSGREDFLSGRSATVSMSSLCWRWNCKGIRMMLCLVLFCRNQQSGSRVRPADGSGWFLLTFSQSKSLTWIQLHILLQQLVIQ